MKLQISYTVPVYVTVDTDKRTVERVIIGDDQTSFTNTAVTELGEPFEDAEAITQAHDIANRGTEWPIWEANS